MLIKKKNVQKILITFLSLHLIIWTLIPSISNINLPLDTIEVLAWGSNLDWGFNKHPPLSAFFVEIFFQIFGNQDWAFYFLSQIFVVLSFFIIFKFSEDFFKNNIFALISVFLLEGIYFYNFTTPEFNVNICQLPFWALTVFYCWRATNQNDNISWLLFGFFSALGILSKYIFFYLIISIFIFFIYTHTKNKKFNLKWIIPGIIFIIVIFPHLIWLMDHDYITVRYAIFRSVNDPLYSTISGFEDSKFLNHIFYPIIYLAKQAGILVPFFLMFFFIVSRVKLNVNLKDKKILFLISITILPIILVFFTSLITGSKIRTMWMTPFYLFTGVLFVYIFQSNIVLNKLKYFLSIFLVLFIFSPMAYLYISITQTDKRTDYPGRQIAMKVQQKYTKDFKGEIKWVIGEEWYGGNLSYHLKSRPKWFYVLNDKNISKMNLSSVGSIATIGVTGPKITKKFSKLCKDTKGKFYVVEKISFCMNGIKK